MRTHSLALTVLTILITACGAFDQDSEPSDAPIDDWTCGGSCDCVTGIAAGYGHACAIKADGTVWCWGQNDGAQLGDGSTADQAVPARVVGLTDVVEVAAGIAHTCVRRADGAVACWGRNQERQLGDGTTIDRATPADVQLPRPATQLTAGPGTGCAILDDTRLWCWGRNGIGLGEVRIQGVGALDGAVDVAIGAQHACTLRDDASTWCWGSNYNGEFGLPQDLNAVLAIPSGFAGGAALTADHLHTCVRDPAGGVACAGFTGLGPGFYGATPLAIALASPAVAIASGQQHDCAIDAAGRVACWGFGGDGRLGDGAEESRMSPSYVGSLTGVAAVEAGGTFTCALTREGRVLCWGGNYHGELGIGGSPASVASPMTVHLSCR